jgi:TolB-like protein
MKRRRSPPDASASAAEWYVALDANASDELGDARFAAWLDRGAESEPELERCEAAVEIARRLADDPELRFAYDEAASLARGERRSRTAAMLGRLGWPKLAWGAAALALAAAITAPIVRDPREPAREIQRAGTTDRSDARSSAAGIVALSPAANPVIVLPGRVAVDANSVAVLPFVEQPGDAAPRASFAVDLHRDLVAALRAVPGLYAIGESSVAPYASSTLSASEIGVQLGARAVLSADVGFADDDVVLTARLADAATDTLLWEARYEEPLQRLPALRVEIVDRIAAALVDPNLRARSARGPADPRAPNTLATTAAHSAFE